MTVYITLDACLYFKARVVTPTDFILSCTFTAPDSVGDKI